MQNNRIERFYREFTITQIDELLPLAQRYLSEDVRWCVAHPVNDLCGIEQVVEQFLKPLKRALPDIERRPYIVLSDHQQCSYWTESLAEDTKANCWVDSTGYWLGTFAHDLFGIPPTGRTLNLRFTEMVKLTDDKISECYLIPDFIDAMDQAGVNPLRKSLGQSGLVMPPSTFDGLSPTQNTSAESAKSQTLVLDMLNCLGRFDGKDLLSMDLENYWHSDFMWYGPAGIGTTRGIGGFRLHHQGPFVSSFPDRSVDTKINIIANGNYVATGGWPHMSATHTVGGWLGLPPSQQALSLRVMDFWRREGDLLKENWVAIDIVHMLQQMGLDVFEQMLILSGNNDN